MKTAQITKKKVITEEKKITKKGQRKKKTPTKMMKIADTGMDIGTDTETDSVKTTPVKNLKNLKNLDNLKKKVIAETKMAKMTKKTKQSLSLKKSTIHLIPADVVVKLVVDFLYDHNLCHASDIGHV